MRFLRPLALFAAVASGSVLAVTAVDASGVTSSVGDSTVAWMNFDKAPAASSVIYHPSVLGTAAGSVDTRILTNGAGEGLAVPGLPGAGTAIRFPSYQALASNPPEAIVSIANTTDQDALDVGSGAFSFRAAFSLDDDLGTDPQDGDNLVQRGLANSGEQWKLSVDDHLAQCFVQPTGKDAVATPGIRIPDQTVNVSWYQAVCTRDSDGTLTLRVRQYLNDTGQWETLDSTTATGADGSLDFPVDTPISIGGKLRPDGYIYQPGPDQFNGAIDNVRITVGD